MQECLKPQGLVKDFARSFKMSPSALLTTPGQQLSTPDGRQKETTAGNFLPIVSEKTPQV
jgi:hypothetical protein